MRIVIEDEEALYHVMSRTALDGFPFGDVEKDYFVDLLKRLSSIYFAGALGFCVMGKNFHLLVRMLPECSISNGEIKKRFEHYYG